MKFGTCLNRGDEGWKDLLKIEAKLRKYLVRLTQNAAYEAVLFSSITIYSIMPRLSCQAIMSLLESAFAIGSENNIFFY